jgi:O-antigen ligase
MSSLLSPARLHRSAFFFCACIIVSIFLANWLRVALGIAMGGLTATSVIYALVHRRIANWQLWPVFGSLMLVFSLHVPAGLHIKAENLAEYRFDLGLQLPLVVLPLSFWLLPPLPGHYLRRLWLLLVAMTVLAALGATVNYLWHAQQINELYFHSKVMPTEPDHIRFSLLITLAIAVSVVFLRQQVLRPALRPWVAGAIVGLTLFLHMLAVRSGEMTFYALGSLAVLWLVIREKRWKQGSALAGILLLLPVLSFVLFPTFRNKIYNTQEDVGVVHEGTASEGKKYSLAARVYSYRAALAVWQDNVLVGVGKPELKDEMARRYAALYPEITSEFYILPHNQYLYNLAAYGALGFLVFGFGLFYPAWWVRRKYAPLLLTQYVSIVLSCLVEYTLETQIGLAFVIFFLLLALQGSLPCKEEGRNWRPA